MPKTTEGLVPHEVIDVILRAGLSAEELASRLNFCKESIRKWLLRVQAPTRRGMHAIKNLAYQLQKKEEAESRKKRSEIPRPSRAEQNKLFATLRFLATSQGLTYQQIADATGYTRASVADYMRGRKPPSEEFARKLQSLLADGGEVLPVVAPMPCADLQEEPPAPLPTDHCPYPPGSIEKVELLRQRASRREQLWAPTDTGYGGQPLGSRGY
jgi:DNA-binding transcriptional regulator YiaG